MSDKPTPTKDNNSSKLTLEQAHEEALALVTELEPEHLDGRSQENFPQGIGHETTGIMKRSLIDICTAIIYYEGNLTLASEAMGFSRSVLQRNRKRHPAMEEAIKVSREVFKDDLESELRYQIFKRHEFIPLLFALKTQARDRGYIEGSININTINFNDFTTEQLKRLKAGESLTTILSDQARQNELKAGEVIDVKVEQVEDD